jgi:hypothetical protein
MGRPRLSGPLALPFYLSRTCAKGWFARRCRKRESNVPGLVIDHCPTIRMPFSPDHMDYNSALSKAPRSDSYTAHDCRQRLCTRSHQTDTPFDRLWLSSRSSKGRAAETRSQSSLCRSSFSFSVSAQRPTLAPDRSLARTGLNREEAYVLLSRGTESLQIRRWREQDSNPRSPRLRCSGSINEFAAARLSRDGRGVSPCRYRGRASRSVSIPR